MNISKQRGRLFNFRNPCSLHELKRSEIGAKLSISFCEPTSRITGPQPLPVNPQRVHVWRCLIG